MSHVATLSLDAVEGEALRFTAVNRRGHRVPLDSGADAAGPSPVELLLIALAGCHAMDVIAILRKQHQVVTGYAVDVGGERREEHPRSFVRIDLLHRLTGHALSAAAVERAITLSHEKYCSVQASLDPRIVVTNRFEIAEPPHAV